MSLMRELPPTELPLLPQLPVIVWSMVASGVVDVSLPSVSCRVVNIAAWPARLSKTVLAHNRGNCERCKDDKLGHHDDDVVVVVVVVVEGELTGALLLSQHWHTILLP